MMIAMMGLLMMAQSAGASKTADKKPDPNRLICIQAQQIGTRLGGQRVCRTKAEWDQDRRDARTDTENAQRTNVHYSN